MNHTPILRAVDLSVGYSGRAVVSGIDFSAFPGRLLTLIGPNGAGKSTILKTLTRQLPPLGGSVTLEGKELGRYRDLEAAKVLAAVLTGRPRPELMRCRDVVEAGRYPYTGTLGLLSDRDRAVVAETMELVHITDLADRDFDKLSDGQRQRVLLARAICQEPRLLVLDEPTSFLDARHKLEFLDLLRDLAGRRQMAVVLSLHELDLALRYSDDLLCVREGRVDRAGTPEEVFAPGYIESLYGIRRGSFDTRSGSLEPAGDPGPARVFVLGGGGAGTPVYRRLHRQGVPFAAGVLPENDLDYPVAKALAAAVIETLPHRPVSRETMARAEAVMDGCETVICAAADLEANRTLLEKARREGKAIIN